MIYHKKMILTHLFSQRLQYFRAQISCELPGGEQHSAFNVIHCFTFYLIKMFHKILTTNTEKSLQQF